MQLFRIAPIFPLAWPAQRELCEKAACLTRVAEERMPDVEVHQSNQPPQQTPPPPRDETRTNIWPIVLAVAILVLALLFFIFRSDPAPRESARDTDRTEVEVNLPEVETPDAPDVKIEVPDRIDVNVGSSQPEQPASTPPAGSDTPPPTGT